MKLPKHLVFSGGGVNGIKALKAIKEIENKTGGTLYNTLPLEQVSASSVGSLVAIGVLLNYSADEFIEHVIPKVQSFFHIFGDMKVRHVVNYYGLSHNESLVTIMDNCVAHKYEDFIGKSISFQELYDLTQVQFNVTVTNVNTSSSEYWNHLTQPDMPVSFAIQTSTCIPFVFIPILFNGTHYVDGAVSNPFPYDHVDDYSEMLGFRIEEQRKRVNVDSIFTYMNCIFSTLNHKQYKESDKSNTIFITQTQKSWDFHIGYDEICTIYNDTHIDLESLDFFKVKENMSNSNKIEE